MNKNVVKSMKVMVGFVLLVVVLFNTGLLAQAENGFEEDEFGPYIMDCSHNREGEYVQTGDEVQITITMNEEFYDEIISENPNNKYPFRVFLSEDEGVDPEILYELEILASEHTPDSLQEMMLTVSLDSLNGLNVSGTFNLYVLPKDNRILNLDHIYYGVVAGIQEDIVPFLVNTIEVRFGFPTNLSHGYNTYGEVNEDDEYEVHKLLRLEAHDSNGFDGIMFGVLPSKTELSEEEAQNLDNYTMLEEIYPNVDVEFDLDKDIDGNEELNAIYVDLTDPLFDEFQSSSALEIDYNYDASEEVYYLYYYIATDHGQIVYYESDNFCIDNLIIRTPGSHVIHTNELGMVDFGYKDFRLNQVFFNVIVDEDKSLEIFPDARIEDWGDGEDNHFVGYLSESTFNVRDHFRELNIDGASGGVNSELPDVWDSELQTSITLSNLEEDHIHGTMDVISFMVENFDYDFTDGHVYLGYGGLDHVGNSMGRTVRVFIDQMKPTVNTALVLKEEAAVTYDMNIQDITGYEGAPEYTPDELSIRVYYQVSKNDVIDDIETTGSLYNINGDNFSQRTIDLSGLDSGDYNLHVKVIDYAGNVTTHVSEEGFYVEPPVDRLRFPQIDSEEFYITDGIEGAVGAVGFKVDFNDNIFSDTDGFGMYLSLTEPSDEDVANPTNYEALSLADEEMLDLVEISEETYQLDISIEDSYFDAYSDHSGFYMVYYLEDEDGHKTYSEVLNLCRDHYNPTITVDTDVKMDSKTETLSITANDFQIKTVEVSFYDLGEEPTFTVVNTYTFDNTKEEVIEYNLVTEYSDQIGGQIPDGQYEVVIFVTDNFGHYTQTKVEVTIDLVKASNKSDDDDDPIIDDPIPDDIGLQIVIDGEVALSSVLQNLNNNESDTSNYYKLTSRNFDLSIANPQGKYEIQIRQGLQKIGVFKRNKSVVNEGNHSNDYEYITIYVMDQERNSRMIHCIYKEEE